MSVFAANLRMLRKRAGLTQEQLAEYADASRGSIASYELGRVWPGEEAVNRIAKALKVRPAALFIDPDLMDLEVAFEVIRRAVNKHD